ncbi:hypothetical protein D9599_10625 [Roseomonas sp. KE2513]|uniref:hypothetical protein n=1 Tax=Roseomonas sp. KE2513 TaxID=2479202 RepID=UPI0018E0458D|nr:hypothetical protein [Roseomonas sp. KE2513]MBI0536027.1 hypothetical protein [Roseomonas sp. KE2513]
MPETSTQSTHPKVVATFATRDAAENALQYLNAEAIPQELVSIRTSEASLEPPHAPDEMNGQVQEDEHRNLRTMGSSMAATGAGMAAAGAVVATGGAALPAIAAAAIAGLGAGAASEGISAATGADVKPDSEKAAAVITVTPATTDQAERAKGVLRKVSALRVWEE